MPAIRPTLPICAAVVAAALPVLADPAPPLATPLVTIVEYGIYCRPDVEGTEAAPETSLGYINVFSGLPEFRFQQQQVPARLGVSFGLVVESSVDVAQVRMETWKPGREVPEIWYSDLFADVPSMRCYSFDFEAELIPGLWRMEAWDGETRLYSIDFEVVPPSALPGIGSDCNLLS